MREALGALGAARADGGGGGERLVVTGGGTGSFELEARSGLYTEVQPGSFAVGDGQYADAGAGFARALSVLATVCSRPAPDRAVVDCGAKGVCLLYTSPSPRD